MRRAASQLTPVLGSGSGGDAIRRPHPAHRERDGKHSPSDGITWSERCLRLTFAAGLKGVFKGGTVLRGPLPCRPPSCLPAKSCDMSGIECTWQRLQLTVFTAPCFLLFKLGLCGVLFRISVRLVLSHFEFSEWGTVLFLVPRPHEGGGWSAVLCTCPGRAHRRETPFRFRWVFPPLSKGPRKYIFSFQTPQRTFFSSREKEKMFKVSKSP